MLELLNNPFLSGLVGGGLGAGGVRLVVFVIKALLAELKKKAAKTPSELDDAALHAVETVVDTTAPVLERHLGKK